MIFQPQVVFNVQLNLLAAFVSAIARLAIDLVRQQNKPWEYYVGYGFGGAALGTGIVGAQAVLYAVGVGTVTLFFESSPGAAQARIFLDGVADGDLDLDDEIIDTLEYIVNIPNDGQHHSLAILNLGTLELDAPTDWLMLLAVETAGDTLLSEVHEITMPYDTINFRLTDAEANTKDASLPIRIPTGSTIAEIQAYADSVAELIDNVSESEITEISVTLGLAIPGGIKADPIAGAFNERGGLITFDTTGPRAASVWIPAMRKTIMPGDSFSLADADVAALITALTTQTTAALIQPVTEQDYEYVTARKGSKSVRK